MAYEKRHQKLLPRRQFISRMGQHFLIAMGMILISLCVGIFGYAFFEKMSFLDALLNAAMILGGMGPITTLKTVGGKIFASLYALFSAFLFIGVAGVLLAPLVHRLLHRFHMDEEDSTPA